MRIRKLRHRFAVASSLGAAALTATLMLSGGAASASGLPIPPIPTFNQYPNWLTSTGQMSNLDHSEGSDTTLYMMQTIGDLYTAQAGLYGCTPVGSGSTQNQVCNTATNTNVAQTDIIDNYDSNEILAGVNDIGSTNGQKELCGSIPHPVGSTVDFARSSKPQGGVCSGEVQLGYAKDSVPLVDFQTIDPEAVGTPTGYNAIGSFTSYDPANGNSVVTAFPSGGIGPVAAGWLPGDPFNCVPAGQSGTACSGVAFSNITGGSTSGATSIPFRLYCQEGPSATPNTSQITDWGQLTNLNANGPGNGGVAKTVGSGAPIGVPIRIIGVNQGSGTNATWSTFASSGVSNSTCGASATYDATAASGQNPLVSQGFAGNTEIAVENNASQIGDLAAANWPNDPADQAVDIATSLYFISLGVYDTNTNAQQASLTPGTGTVPGGVPTSYLATPMNENNVKPTVTNELSNTYPTSRTLFNIYLASSVRASTGGFLNWMCDTNPTQASGPNAGQPSPQPGLVQKGRDIVSGGNFDDLITQAITGTYGFGRLTDATPEVPVVKLTPSDGIANPNASCAAQLPSSTTVTGGSSTITAAAAIPPTVQVGWKVSTEIGDTVGIPSGDTISSISGNTITLVSPATGSGSANEIVYFPGHPPVLGVTDPTS